MIFNRERLFVIVCIRGFDGGPPFTLGDFTIVLVRYGILSIVNSRSGAL